MIYLILSLSLLVLLVILYKRYFPVLGLKCSPIEEVDITLLEILDVRDYNESYKYPIEGSLNIPIAYLKRHINEIPHRDIHLVVSSLLEKNVGIRVLKQKGYRVVGYSCVSQSNLNEPYLKIKINCNC
jgi:rhodanese-related sulfurtransferase